MVALSVIVSVAAFVVLVAVVASGLGPVMSLRREASKFAELTEELDRLRRGLDLGVRGRSERQRAGGSGEERAPASGSPDLIKQSPT